MTRRNICARRSVTPLHTTCPNQHYTTGWKAGSLKKDAQANQQHLMPTAEAALVNHIWLSACSGYPLTPALLHDYANTIIHPLPDGTEVLKVSSSWHQSFLLWHLEIWSHWSHCLDNSHLTGANKTIIPQWYTQLGMIMCDYGVVSTNVFNMDKTGFMLGIGGSEQVIVPSGDPASWFRAQPGTRELATVIECIGSGGQVLLPLMITKGACHTVGNHRHMTGILASWHFTKMPNGWTNNEVTIEWLENTFNPCITPSMPSEWHLLIIDGHGSHTTSAFCKAAWSQCIIPFLLLAHATHVMQPLDVSVFGLLTYTYCHLVSEAAVHVDTIDKAQFGTFYAQACGKVLMQAHAQKAFSDCSIKHNADPNPVLWCLASGSLSNGHSETPEQAPLQELDVPHSASMFNTTIDTYCQEPDSWAAWTLKQSITQANKESHAHIAVLEAENSVLHAQ